MKKLGCWFFRHRWRYLWDEKCRLGTHESHHRQCRDCGRDETYSAYLDIWMGK